MMVWSLEMAILMVIRRVITKGKGTVFGEDDNGKGEDGR